MESIDPVVFALGAATGSVATFLPWVWSSYKKYVLNCGKATCPHHGEENKKRINDINDSNRNGPTRPDIH